MRGEPVFFDVDSGNRVSGWPKVTSEAFGWSSRDAVGRSWVALLQARDTSSNQLCPKSCGLHTMAAAQETIGIFEIVATLGSGETTRLFVRAVPLPRGHRGGLRLELWLDRRHASLERRRHAADSRTPTGEGSTSPSGPLTPREAEILRLLSRGQKTEEIAARLGIAVVTVRNHTDRLRRRLGAGSRVEAVAIALRQGLI